MRMRLFSATYRPGCTPSQTATARAPAYTSRDLPLNANPNSSLLHSFGVLAFWRFGGSIFRERSEALAVRCAREGGVREPSRGGNSAGCEVRGWVGGAPKLLWGYLTVMLRQAEPQSSPSARLPSSQSSPGCTMPSPQRGPTLQPGSHSP